MCCCVYLAFHINCPAATILHQTPANSHSCLLASVSVELASRRLTLQRKHDLFAIAIVHIGDPCSGPCVYVCARCTCINIVNRKTFLSPRCCCLCSFFCCSSCWLNVFTFFLPRYHSGSSSVRSSWVLLLLATN